MNEIFDVEDGAHVETNLRTIFVGYTVWLVNKDSHNGFVIGPCHFGVYQLDSMIDCHLLGDYLKTLLNRPHSHCQPPKNLSPKIKSGREPTGRDRRAPEQAVNYTERELQKQPDRKADFSS
jgi:hypothetical protein